MKIGILKETNNYNDQRTALTPFDAKKLLQQFPTLSIIIQPSDKRIFSNNEYAECGVELNDDLSKCDILLGVKEVDITTIIPGKTYCFFAHVGKKQKYHKKYFQQLAEKGITLIDYEYVTDNFGKRLLAFGYWAGIIGVYYTLIAIANRYQKLNIQSITSHQNIQELFEKLADFSIPNIKILISGTGLTATGVIDTLNLLGVQKVKSSQFIEMKYDCPVYCQLSRSDYIKHKLKGTYNYIDFKKNPDLYLSNFNQYALNADVYLACHYWKNNYPNYLLTNDLQKSESKLKIISDISCDLNGPIASTLKESTHENPFYDYNPFNQCIEKAFSSESNINVMAIGNLPDALSHESSIHFSKALSENFLPQLIKKLESEQIIEATILKEGKLSSHFSYLYNFLNSK